LRAGFTSLLHPRGETRKEIDEGLTGVGGVKRWRESKTQTNNINVYLSIGKKLRKGRVLTYIRMVKGRTESGGWSRAVQQRQGQNVRKVELNRNGTVHRFRRPRVHKWAVILLTPRGQEGRCASDQHAGDREKAAAIICSERQRVRSELQRRSPSCQSKNPPRAGKREPGKGHLRGT